MASEQNDTTVGKKTAKEQEDATSTGKTLEDFIKSLREQIKMFEAKFSDQYESSDFLKNVIGTAKKVLDTAEQYIKIVKNHDGSLFDTANLIPAFNYIVIASVGITGIRYVAMAWAMLETDKGTTSAIETRINHCIEQLRKRFEKIENWADELGNMVGKMKVLQMKEDHCELDCEIILFNEKVRVIKFELEQCNDLLQQVKPTIDEEINKLNFRIPVAATTAGILGATGLGIAGAILSPFVVGVPMIAAAAVGGAALVGGGTVAAVAAVKYSKIRDKFLCHQAAQELLCADMERVTQKVKGHADSLIKSGIKVETLWMIPLKWSLVPNYKCISQLALPSVKP